jgi:hypothetical protein
MNQSKTDLGIVNESQLLRFGISLTQPNSETRHSRLSWDEQLVLFAVGICMGGFVFCGILHIWLSPPHRPAFPEPAMGFTHFFKAKHGNVYGTFFEYLAVTYGIWVMWGIGVLGGLSYFSLKNRLPPRYPRYAWQILAATVISMPLYYAIWQISICIARS